MCGSNNISVVDGVPTCRDCGTIIILKKKNPGLAAVISFIVPGVGQLYNGEIAKGIIILIGSWIIGWLVGIFFLSHGGLYNSGYYIFIVLFNIIIRTYASYDAYVTAKKLNMNWLIYYGENGKKGLKLKKEF
jgi:TM2 domain-containing membrane protein YozV